MDKYGNDDFKDKIWNLLRNNKKIILIAIAVLIFIFLLFLIVKNYNNSGGVTNSKNGLSINLLGSNVITISKNENFLDPGYIAIDEDEGNLTNEVQITGIIDTSKAGTYTRYYTVINGDGTIVETTRTIVVAETTNTSGLTITLKGSSTISLKLNEKYVEPGYTAQDKNGDLTKSVQVTGTVDTSKAGTYTLKYKVTNSEGQAKEVKRNIVVLPNSSSSVSKVVASITESTTVYTKNAVTLTVKIEGTGYQHTILPNGSKTYNTVINFSVSNNSTYNFYVYDTNGHVQTLTKTVNNIDKTTPIGSCSGTIQDNSTILNIQASDDLSGVADYLFKSGTTSYRTSADSYTLNFATKIASVYIYDKVGNYKIVTCNIEGEVPADNTTLEVHYVNVGREDGIVIRSSNKVMVIDGGTYSSGSDMVTYLKGLGITKIDYLVGSHLHYNHIQAHAKIIDNFSVGKVYYSQNLFTCYPKYCDERDQKYTVSMLKKHNITPIIMKNGDEMTLDTNLTLKCIGPKQFRSYNQSKYPQNYNSLNFIITFGSTKFLFTGDEIQQSNVLSDYSKEVLNIDVLKHPHHGNHSLTKTFVETISPSIDIITSASDELSSKQATTKKYLLNIGTKLYYSYNSKNILITSDGKNLKVYTNVSASNYKR